MPPMARRWPRIFAAKGRPRFNPLIVHVADLDEAAAPCANFRRRAQRAGGEVLAGSR